MTSVKFEKKYFSALGDNFDFYLDLAQMDCFNLSLFILFNYRKNRKQLDE